MDNGAFLVARKLFQSELWLHKPASWKVIWIYILGKVNHKKNGKFDRGEGFFYWTTIVENKTLGNDVTIDIIKKSLAFFRKNQMISTSRSTRGALIKVLQYNKYQSFDSYTSTNSSTNEALEKHQRSTPINKNVKNDKNDKKLSTTASGGVGIVNIIDLFAPINPSYRELFKRPNQRSAVERLIKNHGEERITKIVRDILPKSNSMAYAPTITTPMQLEEKYAQLKSFLEKERSKDLLKKPTYLNLNEL